MSDTTFLPTSSDVATVRTDTASASPLDTPTAAPVAGSPLNPVVLPVTVAHYAKMIVPLIGAALITFQQLNGHGSLLFVGLSIAVAVLAAAGTARVGNTDTGPLQYAKAIVNVVALVLQGVIAVLGAHGHLDDVTAAQWTAIALTLLQALGVGYIPNAKSEE